ncbi:MFS transporter [Bordetella genomosp. 9]|uniref:MFS transporter n=2 Tax=Bordetella genomosp. 9 TaxID=1416803 RepID=A0A1W6Z3Z7_9BORD|nr:MFS transporter [Bordetella genomosp. 9]ARP91821.1 MFS transporter [Bordetella genomosp. 9]
MLCAFCAPLAATAASAASDASASPVGAASAAHYPGKPVTVVVPFPPGGATDVIARLVAEKMAAQWKQAVIIRNQPGAGTTLAAEQMSRTSPDGYTLFMTTASHTISASLYARLNYDPIKDFTPISLSATIPLVLVTANGVPVKDLKSLIAYGKQQPNGLTMASSGNGTPGHLTGAMFTERTGVRLVHIPYRGDTPMLTDLVGGQVQMAFVTLSAALPHIKAGKLRAIALAHGKRVAAIQDVPTMAEAGLPDFHFATWFGMFAPAGLDPAIRARIHEAMHTAVADPALNRQLVDMGAEVNNSTPQEFQAFIADELKNWNEGVRLSGARVD